MKVAFAGAPDEEGYLNSLKERAEALGVASQITWLGRISDEEMKRHYARCMMVLFPTYNEDYGYIAPEAMFSHKGVICLSDSGGALEFVDHGSTGRIAEPDAESLAAEMSAVWGDRNIARSYGQNARDKVLSMDISWDHVVEHLLRS